MVILPYKMKSKSAKVLAEALGVRRVRPDGKFKNNFNHTIVNWGTVVRYTSPIVTQSTHRGQ